MGVQCCGRAIFRNGKTGFLYKKADKTGGAAKILQQGNAGKTGIPENGGGLRSQKGVDFRISPAAGS
jgi:hypothetical protein